MEITDGGWHDQGHKGWSCKEALGWDVSHLRFGIDGDRNFEESTVDFGPKEKEKDPPEKEAGKGLQQKDWHVPETGVTLSQACLVDRGGPSIGTARVRGETSAPTKDGVLRLRSAP